MKVLSSKLQYKALMCFLFFISVIFFYPAAEVHAQEDYIILDGIHKFSSGDNSGWALPQFDDSQWKSINVPGSWQSQGVKSLNGIGWYRIRFSVPDGFQFARQALLLGRIGDAEEVFLNGIKIGGEGVIGAFAWIV